MRRARDARRDGPCQCACSLLPRVAFGRSSDQDVHLVIVGDDPIPAPRSSGCRGFAVARLRRYLPAPAESAVCRVSARDSETTQGSKRSQAVRAAYNVIIAYHLGERGAHADARGRAGGVTCSKSNASEFARAHCRASEDGASVATRWMRRWTAAACCVCGESATGSHGPRISTTHGTL